jgi:RHS repeat-associated protein
VQNQATSSIRNASWVPVGHGQREEAGLGLYYYGARWYDPALGHFIQPDTIIPQAGNVLDYHRYSYTRFNPLKYTDPSGHCVATAASVAGALVSGGGSLALSPSSLAFDAACWTAVVAAIQVSNHLADNPPAFPELRLPGGNESYPLTVAEPQIYAEPVGGELEVGVTIQGTSADSTLKIGNVLADPVPGVDPDQIITYATGGTYILRDPVTGQVMRTGRTNDLARREREHRGSGLIFEVDKRTDDYAAQRGREQIIHDKYIPPLNKIRPISPNNPNRDKYLEAGQALGD